MSTIPVTYCFEMPDGSREVFDLELDSRTTTLVQHTLADSPDWAQLSFHQCPSCSLGESQSPHCPAALSLVDLAARFENIRSFDAIHLEVQFKERRISQTTTAQRAVGSMMGLLLATSGCPHTEFLKPMARFHKPLASEEETLIRATSFYLLSQAFKRKQGAEPDWDLKGLSRHYDRLREVNEKLASRLRVAIREDAAVNAVVMLDMFAQVIPDVIDDALEEIRYVFEPIPAVKEPVH